MMRGHFDGSPRAVEAREREMLASPIWRRREAERCERQAQDCKARGLTTAADKLRATAARLMEEVA